MPACIYCIENTINNHCYIGQTINYVNRKSKHFKELSNGTHHCLPLQRAYDKYGQDSFKMYILEEIQDYSIIGERENYWIDKIGYYNICGSRKSFTPTALRNMSESHIGQISKRRKLEKQEVIYVLALSTFLDGIARSLAGITDCSRDVYKSIIDRKTYKEISEEYDNYSFDQKLEMLKQAIKYYNYDIWKNTNSICPNKNAYIKYILDHTENWPRQEVANMLHISKGGLRKARLEMDRNERKINTTLTNIQIRKILNILLDNQYRAKLEKEGVETISKESRVEMSHSKRQSHENGEDIVQ